MTLPNIEKGYAQIRRSPFLISQYSSLERIGESDGRVLLKLEVAEVVVIYVAVVETRIEEDIGRNVLRNLQLERILPLHLSTVIRGEAPQAALPCHRLGQLPL